MHEVLVASPAIMHAGSGSIFTTSPFLERNQGTFTAVSPHSDAYGDAQACFTNIFRYDIGYMLIRSMDPIKGE